MVIPYNKNYKQISIFQNYERERLTVDEQTCDKTMN